MARPKKQEAQAAEPAETTTTAGTAPNAAADAFAKIEPELARIPAEQVAQVNVDVPAAVTIATGALPRIREHRDAIAEQLPKHPIDQLDNLETYALAAWFAHLAHTYAAAGPDAAKDLLDEASKLREGLLIAAEALAHRGMLDSDAVAKIRKGRGDLDMANDLVALATMFRGAWGRVNSKTAVEKHEVDRAAELGPAVMVALATKRQGNKNADTADQAKRAFTLFTNAYDSVRRALTYLRWTEGDVDAIAPSLYAKKRGRKAGAKAEGGEGGDGGGEAGGEGGEG